MLKPKIITNFERTKMMKEMENFHWDDQSFLKTYFTLLDKGEEDRSYISGRIRYYFNKYKKGVK